MSRFEIRVRNGARHQHIDTILKLWLVLGALAMLLIPAARGYHVAIGWLPYWGVFAPALMMAFRSSSFCRVYTLSSPEEDSAACAAGGGWWRYWRSPMRKRARIEAAWRRSSRRQAA